MASSIPAPSPAVVSSASSSQSRKRHSSDILRWPKKTPKTECNTITALVADKWSTVESITIGGMKKYGFIELNCDYELLLCHGILTLSGGGTTINVPCRSLNSTFFERAKLLYNSLGKFPQIDKFVKAQCTEYQPQVNPGETHDSDGEEITDFERLPEYTECELSVLNYLGRMFFNVYKVAINVGLFNCIGKEFMKYACEYANMCYFKGYENSPYLHLYSTATGEYQPGGLAVNWKTPKRILRTSSEDTVEDSGDRYADFVVFNHASDINVVVAEIKEKVDNPIRSQNNEQMLGLWRSKQNVMLGFELRGKTAKPKILILEGNEFVMCYLNELDMESSSDLKIFLKFIIAFNSCVTYESSKTEIQHSQ